MIIYIHQLYVLYSSPQAIFCRIARLGASRGFCLRHRLLLCTRAISSLSLAVMTERIVIIKCE